MKSSDFRQGLIIMVAVMTIGCELPIHVPSKEELRQIDEVSAVSNINERSGSDLSTRLHRSIFDHYSDLTEVLISHGANVHARDRLDNTPLHWAVLYDSKVDDPKRKVARVLIGHGAPIDDVNSSGDTPFMVAIKLRNFDMASFLLSHSANINARDRDGLTALQRASKVEQAETIKWLRSHGAV